VRVPASPGRVRSVSACSLLLFLAASASCKRAEPPAQARDLFAIVRPFVQADTAITALRPPVEVNVWYEVTPDGHLVASGRDTSRVALMLHARNLGIVKTSGIAMPGVLAPVRVAFAVIEVPSKP